MPVKVLDRAGEGDSDQIAAGIRFAADHGAQVINLSFEFPSDITRSQIPNILDAIRYARRKGTLVVGASGNAAAAAVAYPARSSDVLSVGATTQHGCQADYSNEGTDLDIVAPGGGADAALEGDPGCRPAEPAGPRHLPDDLHQLPAPLRPPGRLHRHLDGRPPRLGHRRPGHRLGHPRPEPDPRRHRAPPGDDRARPRPRRPDPHYGWGRIDAARATDPRSRSPDPAALRRPRPSFRARPTARRCGSGERSCQLPTRAARRDRGGTALGGVPWGRSERTPAV